VNKTLFKIDFYIPSSIEGLDKCLNVIGELKEKFLLDFDTTFGLQTVVLEAVENAFIHGNKGIRELKVRVQFTVKVHKIVVEVEDCGEGFDLAAVDRINEGDIRTSEGGRGIFFIKKLSSDCYTLGRGNIFRIILNR